VGQSNLAVVCCLWSDWPAPEWSEEYVYRLYRGVKRNLSAPHDFICFADDPARLDGAPFEVRPLKAVSWMGCLPKLYVYSPEAGLSGRVLLLDLDNVITGPLDDIAAYSGDMCVRAWFRGWDKGLRDKRKHPELIDGDMISFRPSAETDLLWQELKDDPKGCEQKTGGRERWYIRERLTPDLWQEVVPGQIASWKNHMQSGQVPQNARIVSCHGYPRPHEINQDWIREHWV